MIFRSGELEKVIVDKPRGGPGQMECLFAFQMGKAPEGSAYQVLASQTLEPGSGLGYHQHPDNEELYVIISGHGTFIDNGNVEKPVGPGDMTLTLRGESHGLTNTGSEPLRFLAAIAKKQ
ncbi:MAG: cupin domain-containing protein [Synergistaceae bacterium]|jgi:mannose-6-phosphate isomerase-like protein (cupin superfamily)|nr:cupin domain-containing protein [Synergistaceae bacterium]